MITHAFRWILLTGCALTMGCGFIHSHATLPTMHAEHSGYTEQGSTNTYAQASVSVRVDFFGVDLTGADNVVFVLDRSGSMAGPVTGVNGSQLGMSKVGSALVGIGLNVANSTGEQKTQSKMDAAKEELLQALSAMPDGTYVDVVFFGSSVNAAFGQLTRLDDTTRTLLSNFVTNTRESGSTKAVPALNTAYNMGARRVVFLSDGLANTGGSSRQLLSSARLQMANGTRFDTVGVGFDQDGHLLTSLAHESGGVNVMR